MIRVPQVPFAFRRRINKIARRVVPRRRRLNSAAIIASLEADGFQEVRARYADLEAEHDLDCWTKFFDLDRWIPTNLDRVHFLGLDYGRAKRILDIGCGAGYFMYICQLLGHDVHGLDIDATPGFNDLIETLDLHRIAHRIEPNERLPDLGDRYDVITAHMVIFHKLPNGAFWNAAQWDFLLRDLLGRLKPNGCLFFQFNSSSGTSHWENDVLDVFRDLEGNIQGQKVLLRRQ